MKTVRTRRFKARDGSFILAGILDQQPKLEGLPDDLEVAVLARRDLIFLQRLFRDLDQKRIPDYDAFRKKIVKLLDSLTRSRKPDVPVPPSDQ